MSPFLRHKLCAALRIGAFLAGMTCLCLVAIQPFARNQMPYSADGLLQLYRSAALEHSLRVDHPFWPRFSSGLVHGYGAPLFNYFPPLAYFPAVLAHHLGLSFLSGWLLTMSLYTVLAGTGMYLLGRLWTRSELAGWMAAAAYVYSPYWLFDSLARGATAELAALAALPFVFYGLTRLAFSGRRRDFYCALVAFTLFIPLHTVVTLHGTALLALYCLFLVWRAPERQAAFVRLALAAALSLLLTAFYWLPALAERDAIKLPLIAEQLGHIDVTRHLRPLAEVLAPPQTADPSQQNQALPISLGWPQLILAAIGTALSWRARYRGYRSLMLLSWLAIAFFILLNTGPSAWLWRNIPLIGFTQFPWRTLGLASLLLALMGAVGARLLWLSLGGGKLSMAAVGAFALALLLYGLPWTYTLYLDDVALRDIRDVLRFEREGGQLALSSYAEYLPVIADADQLDANKLLPRFDDRDSIARLLASETLDIIAQEWSGTSAALRLMSAEAQTLIFDWLYTPGWAAYLDGRPIDLFPAAPAGLLALEIPAGEFDLRVTLEPTAAQRLAHVLSGLGLAAAIAFLLLWRRLAIDSDLPPPSLEPEPTWLIAVALAGILALLLKSTALDAANTPLKRARFGTIEQSASVANFGDQIDLLAFELPGAESGGPVLTFKLYWRLRGAPLERDYASIIRMRDSQGLVLAEASSFAPGGLATSNWLPGAYIEDLIMLAAPPFTPRSPQPYAFDVGLYDVESLRALSLMNAAGDPHDVKFPLGAFPLRWSNEAVDAPPMRAADEADLALLVEAPALPPSATAGDSLQFSWVWQKLEESAGEALAQVIWLDEAGAEAAAADALPLVFGYDFAEWRVGEVNRGHHRMIVPPTLPAGDYRLGIRPPGESGGRQAAIAHLEQAMTVAVPPRDFRAPVLAYESGAEWGNGIILHGYDLRASGDIVLVWGVKRRQKESLRLFLHALDGEGKIAAQWDGVPVDWTRPTTGWLESEYVSTTHRFSLAPGEYRLRMGWYRPATGERISVAGSDALEIEPMFVIE